jgi:hypothetical protein
LRLNLIFGFGVGFDVGVGVGVLVLVAVAEGVDSGLAVDVEREVLLGVEVKVEVKVEVEGEGELFFEEESLSFNLSPFDPETPEFEFNFEVEELGPATFDLSSSMDLRRSSSSQSSSGLASEVLFWLSWLVDLPLPPPSLSLSLIGCGVE